MVATLCNELKDIFDEPFFDKKYGLVFAAQGKTAEGVPITFPIEFGEKNCTLSNAVVPDKKYRALSYFESFSPTVPIRVGEGMNYISYLSLVIWMNTELINKDDKLISDKILSYLEHKISNIRGRSIPSGRIGKAMVLKMYSRSHEIFSKYRYPDKSFYLAAPYDAIKIDFEVHYSINCGEIVINPKDC